MVKRLQGVVDHSDHFARRLIRTLELHQPDGLFVQGHSGNLLLQTLGLRHQLRLRGGLGVGVVDGVATAEVSEAKYCVKP
jgi:hypothetical protein